MNIEEVYDLELKHQEVYKRTKNYTRNDFVIELIKKDDEKQELIDYLKIEIKNWKDKIFENSLTEDNFTLALWRSRLITYEKILSKIEKR